MNWLIQALKQVGGIGWRWKWTYLVPVATLLLPATIHALRLPNTYDAVALIQLNEKVTADRRGEVIGNRHGSPFDVINKTRDLLLTRENIVALQPVFLPDADPTANTVLESLLAIPEWNRLGDSEFSVRITDTDPEKAAAGVNALVEQFFETEKARPIDKASKDYEHQRDVRKAAQKDYDDASDAIDTFFETHRGEGVGDVELDRIRSELADRRARIRELQKEYKDRSTEASLLAEALSRGPASLSESTAGRPKSAKEITLGNRLEALTKELSDARAEYETLAGTKTENHPQVRTAKKKMERMATLVDERERALEIERKRASQEWRDRLTQDRTQWLNKRQERQAAARAAMATIDLQVKEIDKEIAAFVATLDKAPRLHDKLRPLNQALALATESLKSAKANEAAALGRLRFKEGAPASVITPYQLVQSASVPVKPSGPSRMKFLILAIGAGLAIGYGLMLLRRKYDASTVVDAHDIGGLLPGALVVEVPRLEEGPLIPAGSVAKDFVFGAWVAGCLGVTAIAVLAHRGMIDAPGWLDQILKGGA